MEAGRHGVLKRRWAKARAGSNPAPGTGCLNRPSSPPRLRLPHMTGIAMTTTTSRAEMERLRAEISSLRDNLADSARLLDLRAHRMFVAETPLADHDYLVI